MQTKAKKKTRARAQVRPQAQVKSILGTNTKAELKQRISPSIAPPKNMMLLSQVQDKKGLNGELEGVQELEELEPALVTAKRIKPTKKDNTFLYVAICLAFFLIYKYK